MSAQRTVTFGLPKVGFYSPTAPTLFGKWRVAEIGFPSELLNASFLKHELTERETVRKILPHYDDYTHKGSRGRVVVVAGATGLTGAASLSALGAQRIGAGLVTVACPEAERHLEVKLTEPMTAPVPEVEGGSFPCGGRPAEFYTFAPTSIRWSSAGNRPSPGNRSIGQRELLTKLPLPMVVDADALNLLGGQLDIFKAARAPVVLTPHPGEAAWLLKISISEVEQNRLKVAKQIAEGYNVVLVLKGRHTVIASLKGEIRINPTGNWALATAGTGDVLREVIGGLLAQRLRPFSTPRRPGDPSTYGLAGERLARRMGLDGLLARICCPMFPKVLRQISETPREPLCPAVPNSKTNGQAFLKVVQFRQTCASSNYSQSGFRRKI